jgi:hypothetical protein
MPSKSEMRAALLTAAEVGHPFQQQKTSSGNDNTPTGCKPLDQLSNGPDTNNDAEADFAAGQTGPFVFELIGAEQASQLDSDFAKLQQAASSCTKLSVKVGRGQKLVLRMTPFSFGSKGDESFGRRLDGSLQGIQVNGYLDAERITSTAAMLYLYLQFNESGSQLAYAIATKARAKAARVLKNAAHG